MRERPLRGAGRPAGGAKDAWRHLGMYSFRIERIHPQTPEEKFWEGWRRHKLYIPRRCPEGTGSLIPLFLLFPPQNFAVGAL